MIDIEKLKMTGILVGIRHKRNFSVLDRFGKIVDDVVDNSPSKFPKGYFDGVSVEGFTKSITNEKTKNYIKFTQFDLVYSHNIENKTNSDVEYNEFFNRFNNFIVPSIIEEYNIRDFFRIGIVYNFEFTDKEIYDKCFKNIINFLMLIAYVFLKKIPQKKEGYLKKPTIILINYIL